MTEQLGVAIVGAGYGSRVLVPAFSTGSRWKVIGIAGRSPGNTARAAAEHGIEVYDQPGDAFADPRVAAVAVALPPAAQGELLAAHAGRKHLYCEKPLACDLDVAEAIVARARRAGRRAVVGFGFRRVPAFVRARECIQSGALGIIREMKVEWMLATRSDPGLTFNWKSDLAQGGGTLNLMGAHVFDYARWLVDEVDVLSLSETSFLPSRPGPSGPVAVTGADTFEVGAVFSNGATLTSKVSTAAPAATGHAIIVRGDLAELKVWNSPGDDYYCGFRVGLRRTGIEHWQEESIPSAPCDRVSVARSFAESLASGINDGVAVTPSLADALAVQHCLGQARRRASRAGEGDSPRRSSDSRQHREGP